MAKLPPTPEPTIVDGRMLFTKVQLNEYGKLCYELGLNQEAEQAKRAKAIDDLRNMGKRAQPSAPFDDVFSNLFRK